MTLPEQGSEDASYLLNIPFQAQQRDVIVQGVFVREPDGMSSWLIDAELEGFTLTDEDVISVLKGYIVYGHVQDLQVWTSVGRRSGGSCRFDRLTVCVDLYDNVDRVIGITEEKMNRILEHVTDVLKNRGEVFVKPRESMASALGRAKRIRDFVTLEDMREHHLSLRLTAAEGDRLKGLDVWDVMLCLGLEWGDMDIFHAANEGPEGDDFLFDVSTSTDPGFFWLPTLPEDEYEDLIFTMNIARTHEPEKVYHAMWRCAEYVQSRLGGELQDGNRGADHREQGLRAIRELQERFAGQGFAAGESMALFLF